MRTGEPLTVPGVLTAAQVRTSAEFVASQQRPDGGLPWFDGAHLDPWDHVESAMGLSAAGLVEEAARAYRFSAATQRPDGSWPMVLRGDVVEDVAADTNQCAYLAVGVWHHYLVTGDRRLLDELWPTVRAGAGFAAAAQRPGGDLAWAVNRYGFHDDDALLTGTASSVQAFLAAAAIASEVGDPDPRWRHAAARGAHAVRRHPERFVDRARYSMDWYYPVLAGPVRGAAAHALLAARWDEFVRPGWGVRCVSDRPWFTAAESCELVLALDAVGDLARARRVLADVQHLRDANGGYWTGYVVDDELIWPEERTTWTAAAVILAADALSGGTRGARLFADAGAAAELPGVDACDDGCRDDVRRTWTATHNAPRSEPSA